MHSVGGCTVVYLESNHAARSGASAACFCASAWSLFRSYDSSLDKRLAVWRRNAPCGLALCPVALVRSTEKVYRIHIKIKVTNILQLSMHTTPC